MPNLAPRSLLSQLRWLMGVQVNEMELSPAFFKLLINLTMTYYLSPVSHLVMTRPTGLRPSAPQAARPQCPHLVPSALAFPSPTPTPTKGRSSGT